MQLNGAVSLKIWMPLRRHRLALRHILKFLRDVLWTRCIETRYTRLLPKKSSEYFINARLRHFKSGLGRKKGHCFCASKIKADDVISSTFCSYQVIFFLGFDVQKSRWTWERWSAKSLLTPLQRGPQSTNPTVAQGLVINTIFFGLLFRNRRCPSQKAFVGWVSGKGVWGWTKGNGALYMRGRWFAPKASQHFYLFTRIK